MRVYLKSVGIIAPGINDWEQAIKLFTQSEQYSPAPVDKKLTTILPPNERRRASRVTQLAMYAAHQTDSPELNSSLEPNNSPELTDSPEPNNSPELNNSLELNNSPEQHKQPLNQCLQVFSSSNGDISTFHQISQALAMAGRPVSPTRFHNSVHNAPAGYWSIASQSQTPSTSITAYSDSFSAALLEAAVQLNASDNDENRDCLLVCYDEIPAKPFQLLTHITAEFACALRLSLNDDKALASMDIKIANQSQPITQCLLPEMELLRQANPQAKALTLLEAIAGQDNKKIILDYFEQGLEINLNSLKARKDYELNS